MEVMRETRWFKRRLRPALLVLVVAGFAAPSAQAGKAGDLVPPPDAVDRYIANNLDDIQAQLGLGGPLDAVDRFILNNAPLDAVDRFILNNAPLDAVDRSILNHPQGLEMGALGEVEEVAVQPPTAAPAVGGGFDWADAGVGAAIAFGTMLLAVGTALAARTRGRLAQS